MRFRKLRIAFSITCGLACVLLIALWVRSYRVFDQWSYNFSSQRTLTTVSVQGQSVLWLTPYRAIGGIQQSFGLYHLPIPVGSNAKAYPASWSGIGIGGTSETLSIRSPHYLLVLTAAILAGLPWLRWSRRFSLRTLLIAMTLVAVVLGLVCYAVR
jgi:hypothetical protein